MKKIYYLQNALTESDKLIGPFNTIERACAFIKKHHYFGNILEEQVNKKERRNKNGSR